LEEFIPFVFFFIFVFISATSSVEAAF